MIQRHVHVMLLSPQCMTAMASLTTLAFNLPTWLQCCSLRELQHDMCHLLGIISIQGGLAAPGGICNKQQVNATSSI
jgi:hypothetical protein